ncbi:hypothetical protein [Propioniciclava flava]
MSMPPQPPDGQPTRRSWVGRVAILAVAVLAVVCLLGGAGLMIAAFVVMGIP